MSNVYSGKLHPRAARPGRAAPRSRVPKRLALAGAGGAAVLALSAQSLVSAGELSGLYRIQPGDTLVAISASTGVALERLVALNNLSNPDFILAGRSLRLGEGAVAATTADGPAAGPDPAVYTVQPGDTLWSIATRAGVPMDAVTAANELQDPDSLKVGQKLRLPAAANGVQTAASQPAGGSRAASGSQAAPAAPKPADLATRVQAEARRVGGPKVRLGVAARNLATGERLQVRAGESFPSASVMKLPILVELERQTSTGALAWTDSLRVQAAQMMVISDNQAANQLYERLGEQRINQTLASLGLPNTRIENRFADARAAAEPGGNRTTPADMARLLELIATDQAISPRASADMRGYLERNADRSKLARLLPPGTRVAHKSGWYDGVANDVGIVTAPSGARWVIAVFTEGTADTEAGNQTVAVVSRAVYDAWGP